jgi:hypothetical protein
MAKSNPSLVNYLLKLARNSGEINAYNNDRLTTLEKAIGNGEITPAHRDALLADDPVLIGQLIQQEFCPEALAMGLTMTTHVKALKLP